MRHDGQIIDLPRIPDPRGNLTFIEGDNHVPFKIARVFYIYDVPGGVSRGGHALKTCHQFIVALSGAFDVVLDYGDKKERHHMNRSYYGLHVPPLVWRQMDNFSSGSVCAVLASEPYAPADYYYDYDEYLKIVSGDEK